jgi:hypothetical protein
VCGGKQTASAHGGLIFLKKALKHGLEHAMA